MYNRDPRTLAEKIHDAHNTAREAAEHLGRIDANDPDGRRAAYSEWAGELASSLHTLYELLPPAEMRDLATAIHQHRRKHAELARTLLSGELETCAISEEEHAEEAARRRYAELGL